MPKFELQHPDGRTFEVDAPNAQAAAEALGHVPHGQPMSQFRAALEGVKSGVTAGFSDELTGALYAGAARDPRSGLFDPAKLREGDAGFTKDYETIRDESRATQKSAQEQWPKTYLGAEIGGGLALPVGAGATAATLPARMARGAKIGAGYGAASGVGQGEGAADSAIRAGIGTIAGGTIGTAGVPIAEGVARVVAPVISKITAPIANKFRAATSPADEASRQAVLGMQEGAKSDPNALSRLTPQEFLKAKSEGLPVKLMDMGGDMTRRQADVASIFSPEAKTTLEQAFERSGERKNRLSDYLRQTFHYPDAAAQQEAIETAARAANKAGYARANVDAAKRHPAGLWDESFEQLSQDPTVQAAIRKANVTSRSAAARQGSTTGQAITPIKSPFVMDESGRMVLRANDPQARPTLQFWDEVKKNLDKTGSFEARSMAKVLREHIDELVPSYQAARSGAAHFFGAENALEAGQNFVGASQKYGIPAARKVLAQMSKQERELFQDGYVSRLVEQIEAKGDKRTVLNQIANSRPAQEEIRMAIGAQRSAELEARLRVEGIMDIIQGVVKGNSWTAKRLYDLGLFGGGGVMSYGYGQTDPKEMAIGGVMAALGAGGRRINANVARHLAKLLVSDDPAQLAQGFKIIAGNGRLLDSLRATDRRLAAVTGEQTSNLPAIQSGGVSQTQGNQNQVPRPPGQ